MQNESESNSEKLKTYMSWILSYYKYASPKISQAVRELLRVIGEDDVAVALKNRGGYVFGRVNVITKFCEIFNPVMSELAPYQSYLWYGLMGNQIVIPFESATILKIGVDISSRLENAAEDLSRDFESKPCQFLELRCGGESLRVVASMIRGILQNIQTHHLFWCKACFRRSAISNGYCKLHEPPNVNYEQSMKSSQDTKNKKAMRTFKLLDLELVEKWERHRCRRRVGGEDILLISYHLPIPLPQPDEAYLMVPKDLSDIVDKTLTQPWVEVASLWNSILDCVSLVRAKFKTPAENYSDWDEFVTALLSVLQDPIEETRHPLWIFYILGEAEDWFEAESKMADRRLSNKKKKIIEMKNEGKTPSEIADAINIGKKYIVKILKEEGLFSGD